MSVPFLSCVHTHSHFCDGNDAPEAMVQAAIDRGFVSLGFSGHGYADYDEASMSKEEELLYRNEIRRLQQVYADRLEILLGVEHDAYAPYADFPYDYLIESLHHIWIDGNHCLVDYGKDHMEHSVHTYCGGDYFVYSKHYYEACAEAYAKTPAQIAGHFDLITKYNEGYCQFDETDPRYLVQAKEALACAVERGLLIELNTGAIARGCRTTPYPGPALLRHLRDLGGRVIVNSDCHDRNFLTCYYPEAAELLKACGFTSTVRLRKSGFEEIGL